MIRPSFRFLGVFLACQALPALGAGLDRSGQGLGALFEQGNYLEMSYADVRPRVEGRDVAAGSTGNTAEAYALASFSAKIDLNDRVSVAAVVDQPYGGKIAYASSSSLLGGTRVDEETHALLGLVRYRFGDGVSVHGGVRLQRSSATVNLRGLAYGAISGYQLQLGPDTASGAVIGAAYEVPAIALRVATTYHERITHKLKTTETGPLAGLNGTSTTHVSLPSALNIDFQTGIARDTLLFGQIRHVNWSEFRVDPTRFVAVVGEGLIKLTDARTYTLGVGRSLSDRWSGAISLNYERPQDGFNSPLSPVNGRKGITVSGKYRWDNYELGAGISYIKLGDARLETGTPDTHRATMSGNSSLAVGLKLGYRF